MLRHFFFLLLFKHWLTVFWGFGLGEGWRRGRWVIIIIDHISQWEFLKRPLHWEQAVQGTMAALHSCLVSWFDTWWDAEGVERRQWHSIMSWLSCVVWKASNRAQIVTLVNPHLEPMAERQELGGRRGKRPLSLVHFGFLSWSKTVKIFTNWAFTEQFIMTWK